MHNMISRSKTAKHLPEVLQRYEEDDPGDQSLAHSLIVEATPAASTPITHHKQQDKVKKPAKPAKKPKTRDQSIEDIDAPASSNPNHLEDLDHQSNPDNPPAQPKMPRASEVPNIRLRPMETTLMPQLTKLQDHQMDIASAILRSYGLNPTAPPLWYTTWTTCAI